jgi:hypothetical protein
MGADPSGTHEPPNLTRFFVFMLVFWPLSLLLGVVDHWLIPDYDLRLLNLVLGGLGGWVGVRTFEARWGDGSGQPESDESYTAPRRL